MPLYCQLRSVIDRIEMEMIILPGLNDYLDTCITVPLRWMLGRCTASGTVQHRVCLYTCMSYYIQDNVKGLSCYVQQNIGQTVPITSSYDLLFTGHSLCLRRDTYKDAFQTFCLRVVAL